LGVRRVREGLPKQRNIIKMIVPFISLHTKKTNTPSLISSTIRVLRWHCQITATQNTYFDNCPEKREENV
jgi:hypothetical protein